MNKKKDLKLDNIDQDFLSVDNNKTNNSFTDNTNNNAMNNIETSTKPSIRKTKTTRPGSPKKHRDNKGNKSPKNNKKNRNKRSKKVRFKEKVDIIKDECWKQYNLEQTAEECEYPDDYLEEFESGTTMDTKNEKSNSNKDEEKNKKSDDKSKKEEDKKNTPKIKNRNKNQNCKLKKCNFVCTCNII